MESDIFVTPENENEGIFQIYFISLVKIIFITLLNFNYKYKIWGMACVKLC